MPDHEFPEAVKFHHFAAREQQAIQLAATVAEILRRAMAVRGVASLVVSGGSSPLSFFQQLSRSQLDWSRVCISLADERWLPVEHAQSNEKLVRRHLLQGDAARARFIGLYHAAASPEASALLADAALADLPQPIDVLVLGMGEDGHTASLFPGSANLPQALDYTGRPRCLPMRAPAAPHERLTLTLSFLGRARNTFVLLQGESKRLALREAVSGSDVAEMPIRAFLSAPLQIYWCP